MINLILLLAVGASIGWADGFFMEARNRLLNIVVGIVGAFLAFWLTSYLGMSTINQNAFSLTALMVSLLGASILLTVFSFLSRRMRGATERVDK